MPRESIKMSDREIRHHEKVLAAVKRVLESETYRRVSKESAISKSTLKR